MRDSLYLLIMLGVAVLANICHAEEVKILSPHWSGIKYEIERGFSEYLRKSGGRDIQIKWIDVGGTSEIIKFLLSPHSDGTADVIFGGGFDAFLALKSKNKLASVSRSEILNQDTLEKVAGINLHDTDGFFYSPIFATFGLVCNRDLLSRLEIDVPTKWSDLETPKFASWLGSTDPTRSGAMHVIYEVLIQGLGWDAGWRTLINFSRNIRSYSASSIGIGKDVASGEVACGATLDSYASNLIEQFGRRRIVFTIPSDLRVVSGDPVALLSSSKSSELAKTFMKYLFTEEAQSLFILRKGTLLGPTKNNLGRLVTNIKLYDRMDRTSLEDPRSWQNAFRYNSNLSAERWELMNEMFRAFLVNRDRRSSNNSSKLEPFPISESNFNELIDRYKGMSPIDQLRLKFELSRIAEESDH